ncbi:hypothetical protein [Desulfoferula mesophila]|uniref:Uncharacterized protein n=1 Tax=Desulfoferula mesophila TaxID=3058419 RepID=A0AAU9EHM6_9BACT|nr:hypothetical protein FAK_05470 [Desulfoferula mesophilus]
MPWLEQNRLEWKKPEWILFLFTFLILLWFPLMNGYPFVYYDSWGYAGGYPGTSRSPVLGLLMRPAVVLGGPWGYALVQTAVTAFALVFLANVVLGGKYKYSYYAALVVSGVGFISGYLMADVWALIGFICLFAMATGLSYPVIVVLFAIACSAHYGNFPIFLATAGLFLFFARQKLKFITLVACCLVGALALIYAGNLAAGQGKIRPRLTGWMTLAARISTDMPELIDEKCARDPDFAFCRLTNEIHGWSEKKRYARLIWDGREQLNLSWGEFDQACKEFVLFSLRGHYGDQLAAIAQDTFRLLSHYDLRRGLYPNEGAWFFEAFKKHAPDGLPQYMSSWQQTGKFLPIFNRLKKPLALTFAGSMLLCLAYVVRYWKRREQDIVVKLAAFALIAILINALFIATVNGPFVRFQARIGFLMFFPAAIVAAKALAGLRAFKLFKRAG